MAEAVKSEVDVEPTTSRVDERTPAEIAFQKAREKRVSELQRFILDAHCVVLDAMRNTSRDKQASEI